MELQNKENVYFKKWMIFFKEKTRKLKLSEEIQFMNS